MKRAIISLVLLIFILIGSWNQQLHPPPYEQNTYNTITGISFILIFLLLGYMFGHYRGKKQEAIIIARH